MSDERSQAIKNALAKFNLGDPVSDSELELLIEHFKSLNDGLEISGPTYHLAWLDNFHNLNKSLQYKKSRNERR